MHELFIQENQLQGMIIVPYGSRVYGTNQPNSDYDFIAISNDSDARQSETEIRQKDINVTIYKKSDFQNHLNDHKIFALESWFNPNGLIKSNFKWELDLKALRHEISAKSSHSFVKAKKKIDVEKEYYIGQKSLFHSLRILNYGIQIASGVKELNFSAANDYWDEIFNASEDWSYYKDKFQKVYNKLATEFRKLAPLE